MARINIDAQALIDPRFKGLGKLLGGNHFMALGYMVHIWHYCTERQTYVIERDMVELITDREDFADLLIKAGLAEDSEGGIRIKGLEGRIEWLSSLRENGKKGGRPKKEPIGSEPEKPIEKPNGFQESKPIEKPDGFENENPLALAPSPALAPTKIKTHAHATKTEIDQCGKVWLETLSHFGVGRKELMPHESSQISEAIMRLGFVPVLYALTGARFEKPKDNFDPGDYLRVSRVFAHNNFERFVNLASKEKAKADKRMVAEARRENRIQAAASAEVR